MFKPMLADPVDLSILKYPVVVSPKLDGVRATIVSGTLLSRSLKPFANRALAALQSDYPLDGELIVGAPNSASCFRDTMKVISAFEAPIKDLKFHIFDIVYEGSFASRLHAAHAAIEGSEFMVPVPHAVMNNEAELLGYEEQALRAGFEGVMIRDPRGKYKFGRSTAREGGLLKMKQWVDAEGLVIGFEEQMHNANELKQDALGYADRSSHQANMVPMGTLGALICEGIKDFRDQTFNVGTGFTAGARQEIWNDQSKFLRKIVKYKYRSVGVKDKPRHPTFVGWRAAEDMS
jgi:DNA ligase-1